LIQLLLPLHNNRKQKLPSAHFETVRQKLMDQFGGVTAFLRSPAMGLWKEAEGVNRDEVVMFEVLADDLDEEWWRAYREKLEKEFQQDEILVWATNITKL
jgi:hypothetical protein